MPPFTQRRLELEVKKMGMRNTNLEKTKYGWCVTYNKGDKQFKFHIDDNYPFTPPIQVYCNGNDISNCNKTFNYCYACNSILCNMNWSPSCLLYIIADDYIYQLMHSELLHYVSLILRRQMVFLPKEIIEHICTFIF